MNYGGRKLTGVDVSTLSDLAAEGRLSKGHWQILVWLWQAHLAGDDASHCKPLGMSDTALRHHIQHLAFRGLVHEHHDGGRWLLSPAGREAFGLAGAAQPGKPKPADNRHPFLQRDRESQRLALGAWYDSGAARGQLKQVFDYWRENRLASLPPAMLDICERWAEKLPDLFAAG
ncbi:MAG: hypothetical protein KIT75_03460 [Planctomycetota bacterium]|nr:hypothetical protein [Planctomycetota bacterium]